MAALDYPRTRTLLGAVSGLIVALCAWSNAAHAQAPDASPAPAAPELAPTPAPAARDATPDASVPTPSAGSPFSPLPPPPPPAPPSTPAAEEEPEGPGVPTTICDGKTISTIDVRGQGRVSREDIFATIALRPGMPCSGAEVTRDVRSLWDMGYFADVRVDAVVKGEKKDEVALTFVVKERPAVGEVILDGNDEIDKSDIEEKITLEAGSVLSEPTVREQLDKIKQLYAEKGFFLARVSYKLEPRPHDEVAVRFVIDEGEEVTVRRIRFIGNENLTDKELRSVMQTSESGFFSFLSSNNTYRKEIIDEDSNRLTALYYDYGYLTVELSEPRIELTPDRRYVDITFSIHEGPRFKVGRVKAMEVDAQGNEITPLPGRKVLRESIHLDPGEWFSRSVIAKDILDITRWYRDRGYAHAEITPQTDLHMDTRIVDVVVTVRRGPLVYVQRINIKGNTKTRDEVLRREARIVEGQLYNQTLVERSKERMTSLGYFETVELSEEDGATPDRIILNYEVTERPTGTFQLGAGFSSQETFLLTGQIQQENLFGRGQSLGLNVQLSGIRQLAQVRFVEPYLYGTDLTMAVELFKSLAQLRDYNRDSTGFNLTFGYPLDFIDPILEDLRFFASYRLEYVDITPATGGAFGATGSAFDLDRFLPLRNLFRSGLTSSVRFSLNYDTRDNRLFPSRGLYITGSTELSDKKLTFSDANFVEYSVNFRGYQPIFGPFVGKLNVDWGLITSPDGIGVPIYERYRLGGITDVRGYPLQTLGPRIAGPFSYGDPSFALIGDRGIAIGGNMQLYYNLEIEFPIIESVGIKGVVFQDAGNTWNLEDSLCEPAPSSGDPTTLPCSVDLLALRTSIGFGVRWFSPLGPLRFEWGFPLARRDFEDAVEFQFTVGNAF